MTITNVLLTGGAGYLSSFIIAAVKETYQQTLVDRVPIDSELPSIQGDICDLDAVLKAAEHQDAIVHTVALVRGRSANSASDFADIMVKGTWHVLEACVQHKTKRLVNVSSIVANGYTAPSARPLLPGDAVAYRPGDLNYCISKKIGEVLAMAYAQAHSTSAIHLRPGVIAGDGANPGP